MNICNSFYFGLGGLFQQDFQCTGLALLSLDLFPVFDVVYGVVFDFIFQIFVASL